MTWKRIAIGITKEKKCLYLIPVKSRSASSFFVLPVASALEVLGTVGLVGCKLLVTTTVSSVGKIVAKYDFF